MKRNIFGILASAVLLTVTAAAAHAQATRTWVTGAGGSDANPCSRTAPCQTFSGAFSKTATGGEINCIDAGGYGTINITKSITIDCTGTQGSILASGTTGVIVNGASIVVVLRGIAINGANTTAGSGIRILNAASVNIEDVRIMHFAGSGSVGRGVSIETSVAGVRVTVADSSIYNVNNPGIHSVPTAGNVSLVVDNVQISRGGTAGVQIASNTAATIFDSTLTQHRNGAGVVLEGTASAQISNSAMSNNVFGVQHTAGGSQATFLHASTVTGNTTAGLQITAGSITSLGNNIIRGNAGNQAPTSTIAAQ